MNQTERRKAVRDGDLKECMRCHEMKPLAEFHSKGATRGVSSTCNPCHAEETRERRSAAGPEKRNDEMAAYRAGIRVDKCAVCGGVISGKGLCGTCTEAIKALGGTVDRLKQAARAVRFLGEIT